MRKDSISGCQQIQVTLAKPSFLPLSFDTCKCLGHKTLLQDLTVEEIAQAGVTVFVKHQEEAVHTCKLVLNFQCPLRSASQSVQL